MVGVAPGLSFLGGAGQGIGTLMQNLAKQQQEADQMQADTIIGQLFSQNPQLLQSLVLYGTQLPTSAQPSGGTSQTQPPQQVAQAQPVQNNSAGGQMLPNLPGETNTQMMPAGQQTAQATPAQTVQDRWVPPTNPNALGPAGAGPTAPISPTPVQTQTITPQSAQAQATQQQQQTGDTAQPETRQAQRRQRKQQGDQDQGQGGSQAMQVMQALRASPLAQRNPRAFGIAIQRLLPLMAKTEQQQMLTEYRMLQIENAQQRLSIQQQNTDLAGQRLQQGAQSLQLREHQQQFRENQFAVQEAFKESIQTGRLAQAEQRLKQAYDKNQFDEAYKQVKVIQDEIGRISGLANAGLDANDPSVAPYIAESKRQIQLLHELIRQHIRTIAPKLATGENPG
jgi:hypothetical protein